jgi:hypothetical protein
MLIAMGPFVAGMTSSSEEKAGGWFRPVFPLPVVAQPAFARFWPRN